MNRIVYLCDGKACANCKDYCKHTQNPEHAINGPINSIADLSERFEAIKTNIDIFYKEKEDFGLIEDKIIKESENE